MERSEVRFGRSVIPYVIERGRRLKTVAVGVDPVHGVRVRAPGDTRPTERKFNLWMFHDSAKGPRRATTRDVRLVFPLGNRVSGKLVRSDDKFR